MSFRRLGFLTGALLAGSLFLFPSAKLQAQTTNGIYADFTTSLGNFTCALHYTAAPKAVANFIGLATAQRAWFDEATFKVKTNHFYDGLIFHRVISGFMIQGGCPLGNGTSGPGYAFEDEFKSTLRFDGPGVLAMANSGEDSNGSQFFITVAQTSWLNDVHTIFGRVISGQAVVDKISKVATNSASKPLTNVVIQGIQIRRIGASAQSFDIHAQGVPVVVVPDFRITRSTNGPELSFKNQLYMDTRLYSSTNLAQWSSREVGIDIKPPVRTNFLLDADSPSRFFRLKQVQYMTPLLVPKDLKGRTLTLRFNSGYGTNTTVFNTTGGGTYSWPAQGRSGAVVSYVWDQDVMPPKGWLYPIYWEGLYAFGLGLDFSSVTNGTFTGQVETGMYVSGTFSLSP